MDSADGRVHLHLQMSIDKTQLEPAIAELRRACTVVSGLPGYSGGMITQTIIEHDQSGSKSPSATQEEDVRNEDEDAGAATMANPGPSDDIHTEEQVAAPGCAPGPDQNTGVETNVKNGESKHAQPEADAASRASAQNVVCKERPKVKERSVESAHAARPAAAHSVSGKTVSVGSRSITTPLYANGSFGGLSTVRPHLRKKYWLNLNLIAGKGAPSFPDEPIKFIKLKSLCHKPCHTADTSRVNIIAFVKVSWVDTLGIRQWPPKVYLLDSSERKKSAQVSTHLHPLLMLSDWPTVNRFWSAKELGDRASMLDKWAPEFYQEKGSFLVAILNAKARGLRKPPSNKVVEFDEKTSFFLRSTKKSEEAAEILKQLR